VQKDIGLNRGQMPVTPIVQEVMASKVLTIHQLPTTGQGNYGLAKGTNQFHQCHSLAEQNYHNQCHLYQKHNKGLYVQLTRNFAKGLLQRHQRVLTSHYPKN